MKSPEPELKPRLLPSVPIAIAAMVAIALVGAARWSRSAPGASDPTGGRVMSQNKYTKPSTEELKKSSRRVQYDVTQSDGTEPPFHNAYWNNHEAGIYVDVVSGEPLFSSLDKFDSGTGWPSFTQPLEAEHVVDDSDDTHAGLDADRGALEARRLAPGPRLRRRPGADAACATASTRRRCASSRVDEARGRGLRRYAPLFGGAAESTRPGHAAQLHAAAGRRLPGVADAETAILAGGCFWGMEELLRQIPGVVDTEVGYTGGTTSPPDLRGRPQPDRPRRVGADRLRSEEDHLRRAARSASSACTTRPRTNRQGNDVGTQYRSAIFVTLAPSRRRWPTR